MFPPPDPPRPESSPVYVAWDGNTYPGNPPEGWYLAQDGRWWSPGTGPGPAAPLFPDATPRHAPPPAPMYQGPAPPERRWWEKKRYTFPLGAIAALIVVAVIVINNDNAPDDAATEALDAGDQGEASDESTTTTTATAVVEDEVSADPAPGGGEEAEDFIACTNIDGESYTLEVINQSPKTSSYFMTIVLLDESGARIGDTIETVDSLRPGEQLIEDRLALVDITFSDCELLELDRFAAESDAGEMAEVACTIDGPDVFDDVGGTVTATNGTPNDSDYFITLALVDADGVRRGTASAFVERVRPGETAPTDLFTTTDYASNLICEIAGVERTASA